MNQTLDTMKYLIHAFFFAFLLFACEQDEEMPLFDNVEFYNNHEAANWTKETAKEHLQGRWKLIYTYCCPMSSSIRGTSVDEDYFALQFEGDSVKIFTNGMLEQTEYWEFDERYENALYLESEEYIPNTYGTIYFSEDYILFYSSPFDGPDNYFQKVD